MFAQKTPLNVVVKNVAVKSKMFTTKKYFLFLFTGSASNVNSVLYDIVSKILLLAFKFNFVKNTLTVYCSLIKEYIL